MFPPPGDNCNGFGVKAGTPSNLSHVLPPPGDYCDEFGVGAGTPSNLSQLLPPPGDNCDELGGPYDPKAVVTLSRP